mmetsp:Transcript_117946/g.313800  ORF Transcript_117946/g.313800 Transcript_117946/m.313800 type:complete len:234 (+) Transcript_117946:1-702(+)
MPPPPVPSQAPRSAARAPPKRSRSRSASSSSSGPRRGARPPPRACFAAAALLRTTSAAPSPSWMLKRFSRTFGVCLTTPILQQRSGLEQDQISRLSEKSARTVCREGRKTNASGSHADVPRRTRDFELLRLTRTTSQVWRFISTQSLISSRKTKSSSGGFSCTSVSMRSWPSAVSYSATSMAPPLPGRRRPARPRVKRTLGTSCGSQGPSAKRSWKVQESQHRKRSQSLAQMH